MLACTLKRQNCHNKQLSDSELLMRAGEMAQQLRAYTALIEDPSFSPNTQTGRQAPRDLTPSSGLTWYTNIYSGKCPQSKMKIFWQNKSKHFFHDKKDTKISLWLPLSSLALPFLSFCFQTRSPVALAGLEPLSS